MVNVAVGIPESRGAGEEISDGGGRMTFIGWRMLVSWSPGVGGECCSFWPPSARAAGRLVQHHCGHYPACGCGRVPGMRETEEEYRGLFVATECRGQVTNNPAPFNQGAGIICFTSWGNNSLPCP